MEDHDSFQERVQAAKEAIAGKHVAESTAKNYERIQERFKKFKETIPADGSEVDKVLVFLNENYNKSSEGFRAATAALRILYVIEETVPNPLDAEIIKLAGKSVARQAPQTKHKVKLTPEQFKEAVATAEAVGGDRGKRLQALFLIGAGGYLRPAEALALQIQDLTEEKNQIKLTIKKDKTNQKGPPRFAWIKKGSHTKPIEDWRAKAQSLGSIWLFPSFTDPTKPWKYDAAAKEVRILREEGKLPEGMTLHSLRGTAATQAKADGATIDEVARAGRWFDPKTLNAYIEPNPETIGAAANTLASLLATTHTSTQESDDTNTND